MNRWLSALAVVFALVAPPAIYLVTLGAQRDEQVKRVEREIADLDKHIEMGRAAKLKLPQFREEAKGAEKDLNSLLTSFPSSLTFEDVSAAADAAANLAGVRFLKFERVESRPSSPLESVAITVSMFGDATRTTKFLRDVENSGGIVRVSALTM